MISMHAAKDPNQSQKTEPLFVSTVPFMKADVRGHGGAPLYEKFRASDCKKPIQVQLVQKLRGGRLRR